MITKLRRDDRGSATIELCIYASVIAAIVTLIAVAGRIAIAGHAVQGAAAEAARAASISRSAGEAQAAASRGADAMLTNSRLACTTRQVSVDTSAFALAVGTPGTITATVDCDVTLEDLSFIPGMPGTHRVTSTMTSPLDTFRGRS